MFPTPRLGCGISSFGIRKYASSLILARMGFEVDADLTPETETQTKPSDNEPMLYCPVCSKRLTERKCKLFCEQCGYYMSCADYY